MKYRTIVADPPWTMGNALHRPWRTDGKTRYRATSTPYQMQSAEWICALPVSELAEADAHLFLWVPNELNSDGIGMRVIRAWGFARVSEIIWEKP